MRRAITFLALAALVAAHGDHTFDLEDANDEGMSYAERHMHTEHHIDSFDLPSFFKLHDLDMDGFWDEDEIKAVYGLYHNAAKVHVGNQDLVEGRAWAVVEKVLQRLDTDQDGKISMEEFIAGGPDGLPSFAGYKELGHHYDEESEYFLHHEELYHSTPETQTDESYTHPEDIAHFKMHGHIEAEEDRRERVFEGLPETADLAKDHVVEDPLDSHAHAPGEGPEETSVVGDDQAAAPSVALKAGDEVPPPPKLVRQDPGASPSRMKMGKTGGGLDKEDLDGLKEGVAGSRHDAHSRPRSAEERLRAGVPYKYKMRKGLRSDEF